MIRRAPWGLGAFSFGDGCREETSQVCEFHELDVLAAVFLLTSRSPVDTCHLLGIYAADSRAWKLKAPAQNDG